MSAASSDSDDFFDAPQDFGSHVNSPPSPLLITDEAEEGNADEVKNPNSPCRSGGDLSLEHLIQTSSSDVMVITEQIDSSANALMEISVDASKSFSTMHKELQRSMEVPPSQGKEEARDVAERDDGAGLDATDSVYEEKTEEVPSPVEETIPITEDLINKYQTVLDDPVKESKVEENHQEDNSLKQEDTGSEHSSNRSSYHQPDLVASIIERPSDLPGVQSFQLTAGQLRKAESKLPTTHVPHSSPARPKRPPPPRPKAPPKRPPLPKGAPPPAPKPFQSGNLCTADDGLLTPNSTVDNITREFAAALDSVASGKESPKRDANLLVGSTPPKATSTSETKPQKRKDTPKGNSLSRRLSTQSGGSQLDEDKPWSEMRKETVLRIDSSPGLEILATVIVRNLDTGQTMPLSVAAEQVSQCLNPLSLQIMSRTKEFSCATGGVEEPPPASHRPQTPEYPRLHSKPSIEEDSISVGSDEITIGADAPSGRSFNEGSRKLRMKSKRLKSFLVKGSRKVKEAAGSQMERAVHKVKQSKGESPAPDSLNVSSDEDPSDSMASSFVKTKASSSNKDSHYFSRPKLVQDIAVHVGAVWSMRFSHCGRLLATAGQNNVIWVWVLKDYYAFFNNLRSKYDSKERGAVFATPPRNSMDPPPSQEEHQFERSGSVGGRSMYSASDEAEDDEDAPFRSLPFSSYVGHTADVLDLAWSKNYFTLSSSMDKTVRLWHVSQKECLCCFQHIDFVTAIAFHPKDDRYFLSGSLDSKLRLWNIPEKKVALWNEVTPDSSAGSSSGSGGGALITTVNFCENGKYAVCGTYDGRCLFYDTEHFKYHTQIHVRSSRGRNNKGHKITGIEPLPGEKKILVTSNDSRVRLYDLRDLSLTCKFKGLTNLSSQIKASFSHDCKFIICGSEDKSVYIWRTNPPQDVTKLSSFRRDRNDAWESIRAHDAVVTCAIFAPFPHLMARSSSETGSRLSLLQGKKPATANSYIISADFNGLIKVFCNSYRK